MAEKVCDLIKNGGGGSSESYSTSEKAVGKWADGSTLYRKSYYGTSSFSTTLVIDSAIKPSTHRIVKIEETYNLSNAAWCGRQDYTQSGNRVYTIVNVLSDGAQIVTNVNVTAYNITLYYTKV